MMRPRNFLVVLCLFGLGCSSVRPLAQHGVDLLENTERSYTVRIVATAGSMLGVLVAFPFSALLTPSYAFDGAWGWGVREPTETAGTAAEGDYAIALPGVPIEYGIGMGSGILAAPLAWIEDAIFGEPGLSEGWVEQVQEDPPGDPPGSENWEDPDVEVLDVPEDTDEAVEQGPS